MYENNIFLNEFKESRDYFVKCAAHYATGERYSADDLNGDFWGAHECMCLMLNLMHISHDSELSDALKNLFNDFSELADLFSEIQEITNGAKRHEIITEILERYSAIFPELGTKAIYR